MSRWMHVDPPRTQQTRAVPSILHASAMPEKLTTSS
jgi:hypothetical protein